MKAPRRVVITGIGLVSPLGEALDSFFTRLKQGESSVVRMPEWDQGTGLATRVASPVRDFDGKSVPRQLRRSMSRVSLFAVAATGQALRDADLSDELTRHERTGIAYGSTMGGTSAIEQLFRNISKTGTFTEGTSSTTFLQIMSHTAAANLAVAFNVQGRVIASCVACAASTQAIGFGYEAIKFGLMDRMLCGGAEELHVTIPGVFDVLRATSTKWNEPPHATPRPFAKDRDGIVIGEGAGTLVLEDYETARARGAKIYAEVKGFFTNTDSNHMTNPSVEGMEKVMSGALADAGLRPDDIDYINAHGTATQVGDIAESRAIERVFGCDTPVSSMKGHFGHLMGAAGVVEAIACLGMLGEGTLIPTLHLEEEDDACAPIAFLKGAARPASVRTILKNSFAFGGINASLVLARVDEKFPGPTNNCKGT